MMFVLMTSGMTDPDREKFNKIYHLYASFVYRVALKELSETELAQDCTQAAFERIIKYMDRLEEPDSPQVKSYIYKTVLLLRVSLNAEETVTVFPALFFYPKAGGRRLKH